MRKVIEQLKAFILSTNPYFNRGFANVELDAQNGYLIDIDNGEHIFPSDSFGNYFYIRYKGVSGLNNATTAFMEEGTAAIAINTNLILVAYVKDADIDHLFTNLVSTLAKFDAQGLIFSATSLDGVDVITKELANVAPEVRAKSLQNFNFYDITLISIAFTLQKNLETIPLSCIQNPCKRC